MSPFQGTRSKQLCLDISTAMEHSEGMWSSQKCGAPLATQYSALQWESCHQIRTVTETATIRVKVDGVQRYATPLLQCTPIINFQCTNEVVGPILSSIECRLARDFKGGPTAPKSTGTDRLCSKDSLQKASQTRESWFISRHMVQHNGKYSIVFNCSFH